MENQKPKLLAKNIMIHKESQCPFWMYYFDALMSLFLTFLAYVCLSHIGDSSWRFQEFFLCLIFLFPVFFISGLLMNRLYVTVKANEMIIQFGCFSFSPLRLELSSIDSIEIGNFRPMRDFGGWGIKRNKEGVWGYFMSGPSGVLITLRNGKRYMIGSNDPHKLVAVIDSLRKVASGS